MEENEKTPRKVDNSSYREKFQFQLKVNDNIICQRYFKVMHFNNDSLNSRELFKTLDRCVRLIQNDLTSKSRVYMWNVSGGSCKLTGFAKDENGNPINQVECIDIPPKEWDENEFVNPWDVTFNFQFLVDDNIVYSRIWDGSQYPKYVRNSVDITNSRSQYAMVQIMNHGREDLAVDIIKRICEACSNEEDDDKPRQYTKNERYTVDDVFEKATKKGGEPNNWDGDNILASERIEFYGTEDEGKKYAFTAYNREYVNMWRMYCISKYGPINRD